MTISMASDFQAENWSEEELEIFRRFRFRCIVCGQKAVTLHEIVPKSKAPKTWMKSENRVPLCNFCHERNHKYGTRRSRERLNFLRIRLLDLYDHIG